MRRSIALVLLCVAAASCTSEDAGSYVSPAPSHDRSATPAARAETRPERARRPELESVTGRMPARARRAISDLRRAGYWGRLVKGLGVVRIGVQRGAGRVPPDGHLADAVLTTRFGFMSVERVCKVQFFTTAIAADLARQLGYYAQGRLTEPPTMRQFWAALLGHELVHCLPVHHGERRALAVEKVIVHRLREMDP